MPDPAAIPAQQTTTPSAPAPDTVGTPEGDNEYAPEAPLTPTPEGEQRVPAIDTNHLA